MRSPIAGVSHNPLVGLRPVDMRPVPTGVPIRELAPVARGVLICRVNGEWLSRESWDSLTRPDDVIEWHDLPQDKEDLRTILSIAAIVATIWFPAAAPWIVGANIAYNVLVPPSLPKPPRRPGETGDAFSTGLGGNEARLDQPIPKVCGRREVTPPFACQPYFEYRSRTDRADPNLDNDQYFYALFAVGIGNHEVTAKIGNTPITRFSDILVAQYLAPGELPSTVSANVTTATEVSGQVLESGKYVGGFAACAPKRTCSAVGIDVVATRGLGKTDALSVQWRVEYRTINDFGQVLSPWALLGTETRSAFTSTQQRWSVRYELGTPARIEVRVVRVDQKDTDPQALHEIVWGGLRAYLAEPAPLNEHCAHFEVVMRASDQLSQSTTHDIRLITKALTRTLDADLNWQAEVHTRNPAWWLLDLATSDTWGINKPDSRVDLRSFYDLAQTAEVRQDRFDWIFDSTVDAWDAMQIVARACRARVFRRNGVLSVARDELVDLPVTAFTPRNCQPGMSIDEKLRTRSSADGFIIEYQDHRTWEWTSIECPCPGVTTMTNPVHKRIEGVTGAKHAEREGLYEAANLLYRPRTVGWTTEMQGMLPAYMSPVDFLADVQGYGHSGDVTHWDSDALVMGLSEPADFSGGSLFLTLVRDDGTLTIAVEVLPGPTEYDITLPTAPDFELVLDDGTRERPKYLLGTKDIVKVVAIEDGGKTDDGAQLYKLSGVIDDDRVHTADVHLLPGPGEIQDPISEPDEGEAGGGTFYIVSISNKKVDGVYYPGVGGVAVDIVARYTLHANGTSSWFTKSGTTGENSGTFENEWSLFGVMEPSVAAGYEVRATLQWEISAAGNEIFTGTLGTWLPLTEDRSWELVSPFLLDSIPRSAMRTMLIEIRDVATGTVQDTAVLELWAWVNDLTGSP